MTTKNLGLVSLGCMGWSEPSCERVPGLPRLKYPGGTCPRSDWSIRESPDPVRLCSLAIAGHRGLLSSPPPLSCCRIIRRRGIIEGVVKAVACGSYQACAYRCVYGANMEWRGRDDLFSPYRRQDVTVSPTSVRSIAVEG